MIANRAEYYFAYGSNLDIEQIRKRCQNYEVKELTTGYLPGYRLGFTQFYEPWGGGVADIIESPDDRVWGKLFEITNEALKLLDAYEGYPHDYTRTRLPVISSEGREYRAWVYSVARKDGEFIRPSKRYIGVIKQTARESGFPQDYLSYLESIETVDK